MPIIHSQSGIFHVLPTTGVFFVTNRGAATAVPCAAIREGEVRTYPQSVVCAVPVTVACGGGAVIPCDVVVTVACNGGI